MSIGMLFSLDSQSIRILDFSKAIGVALPVNTSKIMFDELEAIKSLVIENPEKDIKGILETLQSRGFVISDSTGDYFPENDTADLELGETIGGESID